MSAPDPGDELAAQAAALEAEADRVAALVDALALQVGLLGDWVGEVERQVRPGGRGARTT